MLAWARRKTKYIKRKDEGNKKNHATNEKAIEKTRVIETFIVYFFWKIPIFSTNSYHLSDGED